MAERCVRCDQPIEGRDWVRYGGMGSSVSQLYHKTCLIEMLVPPTPEPVKLPFEVGDYVTSTYCSGDVVAVSDSSFTIQHPTFKTTYPLADASRFTKVELPAFPLHSLVRIHPTNTTGECIGLVTGLDNGGRLVWYRPYYQGGRLLDGGRRGCCDVTSRNPLPIEAYNPYPSEKDVLVGKQVTVSGGGRTSTGRGTVWGQDENYVYVVFQDSVKRFYTYAEFHKLFTVEG